VLPITPQIPRTHAYSRPRTWLRARVPPSPARPRWQSHPRWAAASLHAPRPRQLQWRRQGQPWCFSTLRGCDRL